MTQACSATIGPWHVAGAHGYGDLAGYAVRSGNGYVIAVTVNDVEPLEQDCLFNAYLIAAAHDLLEALQTKRDYVADAAKGALTYDGSGEGFKAMAAEDLLRIDAAIAKATAP